MPLGEFCDAFRVSSDERDSSHCLNCLSLEVSDSPLGKRINKSLLIRAEPLSSYQIEYNDHLFFEIF